MSQRTELNRNLKLDRVVASEPELGPSIPDGGYGWVIVFSSIILQMLIPSILASYGIFMLFKRIESTITKEPTLSELPLLPMAVSYMASWCISDSLNNLIISNSKWPRLVATSGICLTCAGLLLEWSAIRYSSHVLAYVVAGILSGYGSSMVVMQSNVLINQYFKRKLSVVSNLLHCSYSLGFIITPILLGFLLVKHGILPSLLIYHTIIIQAIFCVIPFRKPKYLKEERRRYEPLQNISEEDDIFAREQTQASTSNVGATTPNATPKQTILLQSFGDLPDTSERIDTNPSSIYMEISDRNDNSAYSFDNTMADSQSPSLFSHQKSSFRHKFGFLLHFSFYKCWLILTTGKMSSLTFWVLFPTYLYEEMDEIKMQQATFLVGSMGLGSLFLGMFSSLLPIVGNNRLVAIIGFCFLDAIGFFVISDAGTEGWLLFGALHVTVSIVAMHVLNTSVINHILGPKSERAQSTLNVLAGLTISTMLLHDSTYTNCFRMMSLLSLVTGSVLSSNFICNKIKKLFRR